MGYQSLKAPREDTPDDSDNSIQGSPLLDTGAKFASNSVDVSYDPGYDPSFDQGHNAGYNPGYDPAYNVEPGTPYEVRYEPTEYERSLQESPYDDGYGGEYGVTYESGYTSVQAGSPALLSPLQHGYADSAPLPQSERLLGRMEPVLEHPEYELPQPDPEPLMPASPDEQPDLEPSASMSLPRRSLNRGTGAAPRSPATIKANIRNRMSLPPRLSSPIEDPQLAKEPEDLESNLNFDGRAARPKSTLIKGSFTDLSSQLQDDGDDDALPFEATKQRASQGRPQSMIQLSQLNRGPVMTKETFENYRKSVSTLDTLKHMSSRGSFRSNSIRRNRSPHRDADKEAGVSEEEEEDEGDVDAEEMSHEKERKRKSAILRQEQDARMSIYRQKMTKMIGGTPEPSTTIDSRVTLDHVTTSSGDDSDNNEMMDDIPLSILQAHGFPKPRPTSTHSSIKDKRPSSLHESLLSQSHSVPATSPRPLSTSRMSTSQYTLPGPTASSPGLSRKAPAWTPPAVFGNKNGMLSRGLVAEIAKEEEYRKRRNTYGFGAALPDDFGQGLKKEAGAGSIAPSSASVASQPEIQAKLDQLLDMLSKLAPGEQNTISPGISPSSSHALPGYANQRAPSIRSSYSLQSSQSGVSQHNKWLQPQLGPRMGMSPMGMSPMGMSPPVTSPSGHFFPSGQMHPHVDSATAQGPAARGNPHNVSNRPSRMRMIKDNEDEDDDAEWEKLIEKRKELRDQWKNREEVPLA